MLTDSRRIVVFPALAFAVLLNTVATAASPSSDPFGDAVRKATAPLQGAYDHVLQTHKGDAALQAFVARLAMLDEAGRAAAGAIEGNRSQSLDDLLKSAAGKTAAATRRVTGAEDILGRFGPKFAQPLPAPAVSDAERATLRTYFDAKVEAAVAYLADRAAGAAAVDPSRADSVTGLALTPLWLVTSDRDWSMQITDHLPPPLLAPQALAGAERAALAAERPRTAFFLARRHDNAPAAAADSAALAAYCQTAAAVLTRNKRYPQAEACLRAAADEGGPTTDDILVSLAQLLSDTNRPKDAAEILVPIIRRAGANAPVGRAGVLRLKYLFQAGDQKAVLEEYRTYFDDPRAKDYQPQMLYVGWCAARQLQPELEARLRKEFLDKFPTHPLGADLYFSAAMQALAASDYPEARRTLEFIQYRYPSSPLLAKVKEIQSKLDGVNAPGAPR
jgi:tetratricopeptide (TPR) repeat protein